MKCENLTLRHLLLSLLILHNHASIIPARLDLIERSEIGDVIGSVDHPSTGGPLGGFDHSTGPGNDGEPGWSEHGDRGDGEHPVQGKAGQGPVHVDNPSSGGSEKIEVPQAEVTYEKATDEAEVKPDKCKLKARRNVLESRQFLAGCFGRKDPQEVTDRNAANKEYKTRSQTMKEDQAAWQHEMITHKLGYIDSSFPNGIPEIKLLKKEGEPNTPLTPDSGLPRNDPTSPDSAQSPDSGIPLKSPLTGTSPSTSIFKQCTGKQLLSLYNKAIYDTKGNLGKQLDIQAQWAKFLDIDAFNAVATKTGKTLENPTLEVQAFVEPPLDPLQVPKADEIIQGDHQAYSATLPPKMNLPKNYEDVFDSQYSLDNSKSGPKFIQSWKDYVAAHNDLKIKSAAMERKLEQDGQLPEYALKGVTDKMDGIQDAAQKAGGKPADPYKQSGFKFKTSADSISIQRYPITLKDKVILTSAVILGLTGVAVPVGVTQS